VIGGYLKYYNNFQREYGVVAVYINKIHLMDIGLLVALILWMKTFGINAFTL
jgi:hypothetical protein